METGHFNDDNYDGNSEEYGDTSSELRPAAETYDEQKRWEIWESTYGLPEDDRERVFKATVARDVARQRAEADPDDDEARMQHQITAAALRALHTDVYPDPPDKTADRE